METGKKLYNELHPNSQFSKDIENKVRMKIEEQWPEEYELPETAKFEILGRSISIEKYKAVDHHGLFGKIMDIVCDAKSNRDTLSQIRKSRGNF